MSYSVNNVVIDRPVSPDDSGILKVERITFSFNDQVDFPFIYGEGGQFLPQDIINNNNAKGGYKIIDEPFTNTAGLFRQVVNIGKYGWYFIGLPPGLIFQDILFDPDDMTVDLFISNEKNRLLYSFYNCETSNISVTAKAVTDTRSIYSKLKSNPDDLGLRQLYLSRAIKKTNLSTLNDSLTPSLMNMAEASDYLKISQKTLYNWVSNKTIPFTKVGRNNKFRKSDLDNYLDNHTNKLRHDGRKRRKR